MFSIFIQDSLFKDRVSYSQAGLELHVGEDDLKLDPFASTSGVLALQACATLLGFCGTIRQVHYQLNSIPAPANTLNQDSTVVSFFFLLLFLDRVSLCV